MMSKRWPHEIHPKHKTHERRTAQSIGLNAVHTLSSMLFSLRHLGWIILNIWWSKAKSTALTAYIEYTKTQTKHCRGSPNLGKHLAAGNSK